MGAFLADLLKEATRADVALIPAAMVPSSDATSFGSSDELIRQLGALRSEQVVVLPMSGSVLTAALERSLMLYPRPTNGFLHVAGCTVTFRPDGPPGSRVLNIQINAQPLQPGAIYRVAMPGTLAGGAFGYFRFWKRDAVEKGNQETVAEIIARIKPVKAGPVMGRIVPVPAPAPKP